jgi:hypothetical protein
MTTNFGDTIAFGKWRDGWPKDIFNTRQPPDDAYWNPRTSKGEVCPPASWKRTELGLAQLNPRDATLAQLEEQYRTLDDARRATAFWHAKSGKWVSLSNTSTTPPPPPPDRTATINALIEQVDRANRAPIQAISGEARDRIVDILKKERP